MSRSAKASPEAITKFKAKAKSEPKGKKLLVVPSHSGAVIKVGDYVETVLLKGPKKTGVVRRIEEDGTVHVKIDGIRAMYNCKGSRLEIVTDEAPKPRSRAVKKLRHIDRDGEQVKVGNHYYVTALHDAVSVVSLLNGGLVRVLDSEDDLHEVHARDLENLDDDREYGADDDDSDEDEDEDEDNIIGEGVYSDVEIRLSGSEYDVAYLKIKIGGLEINIRLEDADLGRLISGHEVWDQTATVDELF